MRGDRPNRSERDFDDIVFTPHARGSTALEEFEAGGCVVYPACAGIDRSPSSYSGSTASLPRMRGDRPVDIAITHAFFPFTPHARGSTRTLKDSS